MRRYYIYIRRFYCKTVELCMHACMINKRQSCMSTNWRPCTTRTLIHKYASLYWWTIPFNVNLRHSCSPSLFFLFCAWYFLVIFLCVDSLTSTSIGHDIIPIALMTWASEKIWHHIPIQCWIYPEIGKVKIKWICPIYGSPQSRVK